MSGLRTAEDGGRKGLSIDAINVHAYEIVGIAGVSGNGQKDLVEVLGGQRLMDPGRSSLTARHTTPIAGSLRRTTCACCQRSRYATAACRR